MRDRPYEMTLHALIRIRPMPDPGTIEKCASLSAIRSGPCCKQGGAAGRTTSIRYPALLSSCPRGRAIEYRQILTH